MFSLKRLAGLKEGLFGSVPLWNQKKQSVLQHEKHEVKRKINEDLRTVYSLVKKRAETETQKNARNKYLQLLHTSLKRNQKKLIDLETKLDTLYSLPGISTQGNNTFELGGQLVNALNEMGTVGVNCFSAKDRTGEVIRRAFVQLTDNLLKNHQSEVFLEEIEEQYYQQTDANGHRVQQGHAEKVLHDSSGGWWLKLSSRLPTESFKQLVQRYFANKHSKD